ncbi:MAG: SPOR domain-containing protein [Gammaproteobacteria bacterium]|nr:SPOR domain-containing protein [Gammaproteobacteria bacterium]
MRSLVLFVLLMCFSSLSISGDLGITTLTEQGNPVFLIKVAAFEKQSDAQSLQKKLSAELGQPIKIQQRPDKGLFIVQIGPVDDYRLALELEKKWTVSDTQPKTVTPQASAPVQTTPAPKITTTPKIAVVPKATPTQTSAQKKSILPESKIWNLRNADIRAVIGEVSRITKKNFVVDPRVTGKISIVSSTPISDKELYAVFLSMLQVSGYAAIPNGDVVKILPNMDARTSSQYPLGQAKNAKGDDMLVQVVPVQYVPAEQLVPVLRPLMPQWSSVSAYAPSNMLILSGRASNIQQLTNIINQVDNSSSTGVDIIPLEHALAMDIAATLKDLLLTQTNQHKNNQTMIAADDRGNAILVSGSKIDRIRIRMLILQLDRQNTSSTNNNTQVVYLNYLRAEDLVPILAGIAQASFSGNVGTTIGTVTVPVLDSTNPAYSMQNLNPSDVSNQTPVTQTNSVNNDKNASGTSANSQSEGSTKPNIQIIAEPNTNSVIINGPARLIRTLKTVITQLDIQPAQLLIEALIAEIDESDFKDLGLEWGYVTNAGQDSASFRPGFAVLNTDVSINQFQSQIYALARRRKANILSTPSVVILDNRQAKILIGKQVSVASSSYPNNASGTTTASPYTNYDRVNVALHLYVRPQITHGKGIQLQIDQGNDTLAQPDLTDNVFPTFNISAIVTSVHVQSGDIVVLGGLAQDTINDDNVRIPIIGDIPGIGRLFKRDVITRSKKVLMVFIRPHILKTEKDILQFTGGKYNHMRQDQIDIARSQESYNKTDANTIAPPWHQSQLPKPFCHTKKKIAAGDMKT